MREEIEKHLTDALIPFWAGLRDDRYGGFCGYVDNRLKKDMEADKGCILMSRITWFFSNAYLQFGEDRLLELARHGYEFLLHSCLDHEAGGIFWSVRSNGTPADTTKHTYNQAFTIYALSSYYMASGERKALEEAIGLFSLIERKMRDEGGYLEAFDREFHPVSNEKLSENGVLAARTMNTHLHVMEAYTELLHALLTFPDGIRPGDLTQIREVREALKNIVGIFLEKMWNPEQKRVEVFFDHDWNSLIDLWSSGHDIESSWLCDQAAHVLKEAAEADDERREVEELAGRVCSTTTVMAGQVLEKAFIRHSVVSEFENGIAAPGRVWWVQAEAIVGFVNAYQKHPEQEEYLETAEKIWVFVKNHFIDKREGSEWFWDLDETFTPTDRPIVEPWKCPYHNGRMCFEVLKRIGS